MTPGKTGSRILDWLQSRHALFAILTVIVASPGDSSFPKSCLPDWITLWNAIFPDPGQAFGTASESDIILQLADKHNAEVHR